MMVILITGVPSSGKTTIGKLVAEKINFDFIDGIGFRKSLKLDKDFSYESSSLVIEKLIEKLKNENKNTILAMVIPWKDLRDKLKNEINDFYEILLQSKIKRSITKDYGTEKVPGIHIEYENSTYTDLRIDTSNNPIESSVNEIIEFIQEKMIELSTTKRRMTDEKRRKKDSMG